MKTIFLLFDSLNLKVLETYGSTHFATPNFRRLSRRAVTFGKHFVGSMPCMPARRDMQSGRLNFLHRGWGPLEPFDNSFPELLKQHDVYAHLISDHYHYFEDGGATYHTRYTSFDFIRGQERDPWKAMVAPPIERFRETHHKLHMDKFENDKSRLAYAVNRDFIKEEKDFPSVQCFAAGLEFLKTNKDADDWCLQIETFDPHEPFFAPDRFRALFDSGYRGPFLDWPDYGKVDETPEEVAELRANYFALVCLCDHLLGTILDFLDAHDMWDDTALVLTTDHGFLLGEHDWWGKGQMPIYDEIAHIPLFFHHPDFAHLAGTKCNALTQNIDLMPTFLELHGVEVPKEVQGISLMQTLQNGSQRKAALYGYWGSGINITDGRHSYFWYPENDHNAALNQYTLMPTNMQSFFSAEDLQGAELTNQFSFTKGFPVMRVPYTQKSSNKNIMSNIDNASMLFDIEKDPLQLTPIADAQIADGLKSTILEMIDAMEAPPELVARFQNSR